MTWNEFKEFIDKELKERGLTGKIEIDYIDISLPGLNHPLYTPKVILHKGELGIHT